MHKEWQWPWWWQWWGEWCRWGNTVWYPGNWENWILVHRSHWDQHCWSQTPWDWRVDWISSSQSWILIQKLRPCLSLCQATLLDHQVCWEWSRSAMSWCLGAQYQPHCSYTWPFIWRHWHWQWWWWSGDWWWSLTDNHSPVHTQQWIFNGELNNVVTSDWWGTQSWSLYYTEYWSEYWLSAVTTAQVICKVGRIVWSRHSHSFLWVESTRGIINNIIRNTMQWGN